MIGLAAHMREPRRPRRVEFQARALGQPFRALGVHQRIVVGVALDGETGGKHMVLHRLLRFLGVLPVMREFGEVLGERRLVAVLDQRGNGAMQRPALRVAQQVVGRFLDDGVAEGKCGALGRGVHRRKDAGSRKPIQDPRAGQTVDAILRGPAPDAQSLASAGEELERAVDRLEAR